MTSLIDSLRLSTHPPSFSMTDRILLVDARDRLPPFIEELPELSGWELHLTKTPAEALVLARTVDPDLILIVVEGLDNEFDFCQALAGSQTARQCPVILLGDGAENQIVKALTAGADDYIALPPRMGEFRARIGVQLRNGRRARALQRVRSERDLARRQSQTDALTGLKNRGALERGIHERCKRGEAFGLLFIDVDHFKSVNDGFGHDMGDRVLIQVAELLRRELGEGELVGRYGGEEFVAVVVSAGANVLRLLGERIRLAVEQMTPPGGGPSQVTVSIGATTFEPEELRESPQELVQRADAALYVAKRTGRNQVVTVPSGGSVQGYTESVFQTLQPVRVSIRPSHWPGERLQIVPGSAI